MNFPRIFHRETPREDEHQGAKQKPAAMVSMHPTIAARMRSYPENETVRKNVDAGKARAKELLNEL